jgi:hypothetical protein
MSKQFENMQKLAFGKVLINESMDTSKITKSALKDKIREMVLDEAKKKKKSKPEDVAPQEDVDIDITAKPAAEAPAEPSMDAAHAEPTNSGNVVRDIQNLLQDAFEKAQQLPDNEDKEKTINQISNTIKMFINTQVLGSGQQPGIAENLNEDLTEEDTQKLVGMFIDMQEAIEMPFEMGMEFETTDEEYNKLMAARKVARQLEIKYGGKKYGIGAIMPNNK